MSLQSPDTLLRLIGKNLLKAEALAISALKNLSMDLFPPLFKEAFESRKTDILKEMVAAWSFPCLPVGTLMKTPHLETLQALLDGLDMLLIPKGHHSGCELRVLDLRIVHHNFWNIWAGSETDGCSLVVLSKRLEGKKKLPRYALRRCLKVSADLCLIDHLHRDQAYILQWAQKRRGSLQLCCRKLQIYDVSVHRIRKVLEVFRPEYIEELDLMTGCSPSTLARFSSQLGQMINLRKLLIEQINKNITTEMDTSFDIVEKCVTKFICQFSTLSCLQHLHMNSVHFLNDHMKQLFRCLKTPLETLSITHCRLSQSDLNSMSQCRNLCQLKHLDLRGVILFDLCLVDLRDLLEDVADTLQTLDLEGCRMRDPQLMALLPGLSQCSQLTKVNFYDNLNSLPILKDLLRHTANLSQLTLEKYPVPLEFYDDMGNVLIERYEQFCPELIDVFQATRKPKTVSFATDNCSRCYKRCVYDLGPRHTLSLLAVNKGRSLLHAKK